MDTATTQILLNKVTLLTFPSAPGCHPINLPWEHYRTGYPHTALRSLWLYLTTCKCPSSDSVVSSQMEKTIYLSSELYCLRDFINWKFNKQHSNFRHEKLTNEWCRANWWAVLDWNSQQRIPKLWNIAATEQKSKKALTANSFCHYQTKEKRSLSRL